jgi:hypothetical protein
LIYGDNHIKIIEKFSSHPHIKALNNDNPFCPSMIAFNQSVFAQGSGITDNTLYTKTSNKVAIILFFKDLTANIDFIYFNIII